MPSIIIGTRGSDLALWQAYHVKAQLERLGAEVILNIIKTKGDEIQHLSFDKIEGKGFFTKEIEDALLRKEIDIAVHSHKDLETEQPQGLVIGAVSDRANPSDILIIQKNAWDQKQRFGLKASAVLGTSSVRRKAMFLHYRNDVELKDLRGNVPTRIQKLREGQYDAILLAKAGVDRLNIDLSEFETVVLSPTEFIPAPAQGVLALQCREEDTAVRDLLSKLNDAATQQLISIERGVLNKMQGGCHLPLGVYATTDGEEFEVHVAYAPTWQDPMRLITFISNNASELPDIIINELKPGQ